MTRIVAEDSGLSFSSTATSAKVNGIKQTFRISALKSGVAVQRSNKRYRPKVGRPTAEQVSAINRTILTAATERFLADGYDGASMDAIAAAAGVSKGTLYSRYPQKESLLRTVVEDRVAAWSAEASKQNWMLGDTLEQRLKQHAKTMMVWAASAEVRAFDRLLSGAWGAPPEVGRALYEIRYSSMVELFAREIREFTRADGKPARNPKRVALTLMATLGGWLRMERLIRDVSKREAIAFARHAVDLLIAGRSAW